MDVLLRARRALLLGSLLLALAPSPAFAGPVPRPPDDAVAASLPSSSHGLASVDGRIVAGGPDWRATFDDGSFSFTPAFGAAASRTWPLTLTLESVRRLLGPERVPAGAGAAVLAGETVEIARGLGLVERYEPRREGVEQSFVLSEPPPGEGDLVVRLRVTTDLQAPPAGDHSGGLAFAKDGLGAVTIGGVTGIDAHGRTTPGSLRYDGSCLEYALPAAFVDEAKFPLVVDPLIGPALTVASGFDEAAPDVSHDASTNRFLVVWDRTFASGDHDVRGQLVDADGTLSGGLLFLDSNSGVDSLRPRVGNVNASNHFVVAWTDSTGFLQGTVRARTVLANTGALGPTVTVSAATGLHLDPDVGGEYLESVPQAMVVWQRLDPNLLTFEVAVARLQVAANGAISVGAPLAIGTGYDDVSPSISNTGGPGGVYMAAWRRRYGGLVQDTIRAAAFDRNLTLVDELVVVTDATSWADHPSVDGDGNAFLVAYELEATQGSGDKDVVARPLVRATGAGGHFVPGAEIPVDVGALDSANPDVTWLSGSALVAFRQLDLTNVYRAMLRSFDGLTGASCENTFALSTSGENVKAVRIGASAEDHALIAYEADPVGGGSGAVRARRFLAADGVHQSLGGQCSAAAMARCARVPNAQFALRLSGAPATSATFLVLGTSTTSVACGPCVLTVDPASGLFLSAGATDHAGSLEIVTGLPNDGSLVGLTFGIQWLTVKPSGAPCPDLNATFSNGLRVTLQ